jgi:hypothetical protein
MSRGVRDVSGYEHFEERLRAAHAEILAQRPDERPPQFEMKRNEAGQTAFVDPDDVRGTLRQGFEMTRSLEAPFARAPCSRKPERSRRRMRRAASRRYLRPAATSDQQPG